MRKKYAQIVADIVPDDQIPFEPKKAELVAYHDYDEHGNDSYTVYEDGHPVENGTMLSDELDSRYPGIEIAEGLDNRMARKIVRAGQMPEGAEERHLEYLDDLRESGETNMFGAGEYLEAEFDLDRNTARAILKYWMESFGERHGKKKTAKQFSSIVEFRQWLTEVDGSLVTAADQFGHQMEDHIHDAIMKASDLIGNAYYEMDVSKYSKQDERE